MVTEDQSDVIEFLASPEAHNGVSPERVETHASIVFLAGDRALKLKRAVRYDYLDFSTLERRKSFCEAELQINRRAAPALYRRVVAVTRERNGSLALDGAGAPVEWLLEMFRFDQEMLFDRLAARSSLSLDLMPVLARVIARFHRDAERHLRYGGRAGIAWVIDGNAEGFREYGDGIFDTTACAELTAAAHAALARHAALLDARRDEGLVRECHGDLHLRNLVLFDGAPTPFDAIEFNPDLTRIDVLYDLAFLLMDLWHRRLTRHSHIVFNTYVSETESYGGLSVLPLFLSCRAAVRAKTSAAAARLQTDAERRRELQHLARRYLSMARDLLQPLAPCLIAIGGFSGSGKSTVALATAPIVGAVPGALVVRSDEVRKRLAGVPLLSRLGPEAYTLDASERVYATVAKLAEATVRAGHAVIVDAVFARAADRDGIEELATSLRVPFLGLWLNAPDDVLFERVKGRHEDPSDADAAVIRAQRSQETGPIRWHRVDASNDSGRVIREVGDVLARHLSTSIRRETDLRYET